MQPPFQLRDFLKVFALSIALFAGFAALFAYVPQAADILGGFHPTVAFLIQYLIQFVVLFFPLWLFVVDKYSLTLADFGFKKVRPWLLIKTVLSSYLFYLAVSFIFATILYYAGLSLPGYQEQESYLPLFGYDAFGLTIAFLIVSIFAPLIEELFFRGFIYRTFTKTWPLWLASILTATLFALIHFQLQTFIPLFFLGLILNYTYQRTGSLWTSVAFHSLNNTIALAFDIYLYFHPELLDKLTF
ncbi:MAG: type II CAAX endopeptidase family protein [Candidatus Gracilibacteria bacterium]